VYKLAEIDGRSVLKISGTAEKTTSPGRKQVWRRPGSDVIGLDDEDIDGQPLLVRVMEGGRRLVDRVPLLELRDRCLAQAKEILPQVRSGFEIRRSERLDALRAKLLEDLRDGVA
jgi:nicotinate phosphoribosyltransferase